MGIGKGKSDKINIDGLIESTNNESKILQVERSFTENIAELKQTTAVLNAAIDRMESIVSKFNSSAQEMQMKKIDAQVHPQTLKSLNNICMNFVVEVGRQLMAHRNKQLELQKEADKQDFNPLVRKPYSFTFFKHTSYPFFMFLLQFKLFVPT